MQAEFFNSRSLSDRIKSMKSQLYTLSSRTKSIIWKFCHFSFFRYHTHTIITRGLYTFYPLFEVHLCTVTFGLMYGWYSRVVSNQERVIVEQIRYIEFHIYFNFKIEWLSRQSFEEILYIQ
jgi:hypothetical protein